ncbi:MAG: zinc ribbon domain-containing protein [candidate division WOR-3 bacterium]
MEFQKKGKEEKKVVPSKEEREGKECPNCHSINDTEAKFCAECGYDFTGGRKCPKCGAKIVAPNADICEVCGEWLLEGKCKFCYADLEEGAAYCAECGNPVGGIVCPKCGKLSCFDFCKFCNTPLTAVAQQMIERIKKFPQEEVEKFTSNQEARAYYMAQKYLVVGVEVKEGKENKTNELLKLKEYLEKVEKKTKKKIPPPLFTDEQKQSILSTGKEAEKEIQRQEEERRRQEEERRRQEEERRRQEEERRRQEEEERKLRGPKGWVCNAFGAFHPGGPCECAAPEFGGHWIY